MLVKNILFAFILLAAVASFGVLGAPASYPGEEVVVATWDNGNLKADVDIEKQQAALRAVQQFFTDNGLHTVGVNVGHGIVPSNPGRPAIGVNYGWEHTTGDHRFNAGGHYAAPFGRGTPNWGVNAGYTWQFG